MDSNKVYAQARIIVRKKLSERLGGDYDTLPPQKQRMINEAMASKNLLIRQLAQKLMKNKEPSPEEIESKTLHNFYTGSKLQNMGSPERGEADENGRSVDRLFTERFASENPIPKGDAKVVLYPKQKPRGTVKMLRKFSEEFEQYTPVCRSIIKKADQFDVPLEVLGEVYDRGMSDWTPEEKQTQQQYAFARINSFVNKGKTYFNEDKDLQVEARAPNKPFVKPYFDSAGKQLGWKSGNKWGKTKYWQMAAKESAKKHAGLTDEVKESTDHLNESFNIAFPAGAGVMLTAKDLGINIQGGFAHHPSVVDEMRRRQEEAELEEEPVVETVKTADRRPVTVPAYTRYTPDATGKVVPKYVRARTVLRREGKQIIKSGNVYDGKSED